MIVSAMDVMDGQLRMNPVVEDHVELAQLAHSGVEDLEACESRLDVAAERFTGEEQKDHQKGEKEEDQGAAHCHLHDDVQSNLLRRVVLAWAFMW
jgi:hypothetical protein